LSYQITVIPGDGIGPEIMDATLQILEATGIQLVIEHCIAGQNAEKTVGHPLPQETIESLNRTKVGLKGPLIVEPGSPPVVIDQQTYGSTNGALRGVCNAFANVRPAKRFDGVPGRFTDLPIDIVIVREVSEGVYVGGERVIEPGRAEAIVVATRKAAERVSRLGFQMAQREDRKKVTLVHKANVLPSTDGMYLEVFYEVSKGYPTIVAEARMIDAAAAEMILNPQNFDMIVAPNQYGDILSDISAAVIGGLGLGPGANYGKEIALFEAIHGAAPDIAGQNIANPIALILSGAMMLYHVGEQKAARLVRTAVESFLRRGEGLTPDLGGTNDTMGVAKAIAGLIKQSL